MQKEIYDVVRKEGMRAAFLKSINAVDGDVDFDDMYTWYDYSYFVTRVYRDSMMEVFNQLYEVAQDDGDAASLNNAFSIAIVRIKDQVTTYDETYDEEIKDKDHSDSEVKIAQMNSLITISTIDQMLLPMINSMVHMGISLDSTDVLLTSMQEFDTAFNRLIEMGNQYRASLEEEENENESGIGGEDRTKDD